MIYYTKTLQQQQWEYLKAKNFKAVKLKCKHMDNVWVAKRVGFSEKLTLIASKTKNKWTYYPEGQTIL